jgi:hypothetical protein
MPLFCADPVRAPYRVMCWTATTVALEKVLFDERARAELLAAAPAVLVKFSWRKAGRETLNVSEEVASKPDA